MLRATSTASASVIKARGPRLAIGPVLYVPREMLLEVSNPGLEAGGLVP
jgi:hypothetical protein